MEQRHLPFDANALEPFVNEIFESFETQAARLLWCILETGSPRKSQWSQVWSTGAQDNTNYKAIDRVLARLREQTPRALHRLFDPECPYVLFDSTDIPRPQARNTRYVGRLKDGKTLGFTALVLAQPYRGRALPFEVRLWSEATLEAEVSSRNLEWRKVVCDFKQLLGDCACVFDREYSTQGFLETMQEMQLNFVIRLNTGNRVGFLQQDKKKMALMIAPGQSVLHTGVFYKGEVQVNLAGFWLEGMREPMWVMGSLPPEQLLKIYQLRMKIEQTFKDNKSLLGLEQVMNKRQDTLEQTLQLMLLAYSIGLLVGEQARDELYGPSNTPQHTAPTPLSEDKKGDHLENGNVTADFLSSSRNV